MAAEKLSVVEAMAAVMAEVQSVGKDGFHDAPGAKFKFRGVDAVVNAVGPALRKYRVVVVPQLQSIEHRDVQTSGGKASRETTVLVKYLWTGPDGTTLETIVPGEAMDNGDKGTAKAMSVAFRIALLQALCLPTDDADPDSQAYERAAPTQRQASPQGQNAAPRSEPQQIVSKEAKEALEELAATCDAMGYDRGMVAKVFAAEHNKADIRKAATPEQAAVVRQFIAHLDDVDPTRLKAAATNGAQA